MTEYGLRKAIANLKKLGLIQTAQHWINQYKRVMFYRIDYDRLNQFAEGVCEEITFRGVEGDRIEMMTGHNTDPETSPDTSFPEQQTDVVLKEKESEKVDGFGVLEDRAITEEEMQDAEEETHSPESSGNDLKCEPSTFPELKDAVGQAIGLPSLPTSLKLAIERFPERVKPAIAYLQYQQQRRQVQNPVGYLYEAIVSDWDLSIPGAIVPPGFGEWFDRTRTAGLVVAAMVIDGAHQTLHRDLGWILTEELMRQH